jgi:RimJ/RimL family protein N-acetyltransferase
MQDLGTLAEWFEHSPDFAAFDRDAKTPVSREALEEVWRHDLTSMLGKARWFIVEDDHQAPLALGGLVSINSIHGDAVLPVFVARHARGRGIATRLIGLLFDYGFNHLGLSRVTTYLRDDNCISRRLTAGVGFVEEGRMRQAWLWEGVRFDTILLGILKEEWECLRPKMMTRLGDAVVLQCDVLEKGVLRFPESRSIEAERVHP